MLPNEMVAFVIHGDYPDHSGLAFGALWLWVEVRGRRHEFRCCAVRRALVRL